MNITDLIRFRAEIEPEHPAIIAGDRIITFGLLERGVRTVMRKLAALRLPPTALVGLAVDNPLRHMALSLALARSGMASVALQRDADLSILPPLNAILSEKPGGTNPLIVPVGDEWFTPGNEEAAPAAAGDGKALSRVVMSSGSTGVPKAIAVSQAALEARVDGVMRAMDVAGAVSRVQCLMDLASAWGFTIAVGALSRGKTVCFAGSIADALRMMSLYGADYLVCSAFQLRTLVQNQNDNFIALPTLKAISVGGASAADELVTAAQTTLCRRILTMYGSAEMGLTAFEVVGVRARKLGDTGVMAPWVEAEVLDDAGALMPAGGVGELRLRGAAYGPALHLDGSFPSLAKDWFYPGDIASVSTERRLTIIGRSREIINIGGAKISPEAIEASLAEVEGVRDAGVGTRPGPDGLAMVVAVVVCDGAVDDATLQAAVARKFATFVPAEIKRVAILPRGDTGKIQRRDLANLLQ